MYKKGNKISITKLSMYDSRNTTTFISFMKFRKNLSLSKFRKVSTVYIRVWFFSRYFYPVVSIGVSIRLHECGMIASNCTQLCSANACIHNLLACHQQLLSTVV